MSDEPPAGDVEVLSGDEPPPRRPRPSGWKPWVVALVIAFIAAIAWLNVSGRGERGPISDDPFDPGARTQPLYPGAVGQLLFTVQEEPAAGQLAGETLWSVQLGTGAASRGPLLLPVGAESGVPAAPGVPPNRGFSLGPAGTAGAGTLAFLADTPEELGGRRFVFGLDVGARLDLPPAPIAEGTAFTFGPGGDLYVLRPERNAEWTLDLIGHGAVARLGRLPDSTLGLAVSGSRLFVIQGSNRGDGDVPRFARILAVEDDGIRPVLAGYRVVGVGLHERFLVRPLRAVTAIHLFEPPARPRELPGFGPTRIVGWTSDRQHYAAEGTFRGRDGLWFVQWPNAPVFMMMPIDLEAGESIDVVAFDEQARVAFFVHELDIWAVEIGSERAFKLPLPDDAAREVPSGPVVWVP